MTIEKPKPVSQGQFLFGLAIMTTAIAVGLGYVLAFGGGVFQQEEQPELNILVMMVLAILITMGLLYAIAIGFHHIGLTDKKAALGLPQGSIRALIALFLIVIFVLFGVHLFRIVANTTPGQGPDDAEMSIEAFEGLVARSDVTILSSERTEEGTAVVSYRVRPEVGEDTRNFAQQILTTVGTLVVAVSGFYFGSRAAESFTNGSRGEPEITGLHPADHPASAGQEVPLSIIGRNLKVPRAVRLTRGPDEVIEADIVAYSSEWIKCTMKVVGDSDGLWSVVIDNQDGTETRLNDAFQISA